MMGKRILIVDDEEDLRELLSYNLAREGYETIEAAGGEDALLTLRNRNDVALVILDLMLPGLQGTEVLRRIRQDGRTARLPVIMLTARGEEADKVLGLELGADDYVTKPFSPRELLARVRAVMRRGEPGGGDGTAMADPGISPDDALVIGGLVIDRARYTVSKNGAPLELSPTEYALLRYLAEHRGRVYTRDMLLDAVWRGDAFVEPRTVDVHIRRLRTKVEDDPSRPNYIKTRRGVGYYFEAPAR